MEAPPPLDVCLASLNFYPSYAGVAIRFQRYAVGLRARDVHVRVFTGTPEIKRVEALPGLAAGRDAHGLGVGDLLPMLRVDGLPIQQVKLSGTNRRERHAVHSRALADYCCQPINRPDLIQFLSLSLSLSCWLMARRLRRLGIPLVFTHTLLGELSTNSLKRWLQRIYWRLPLQWMDCVVVSSNIMKDALSELGVSVRTEVIPNGVDLNRFHPVGGPAERNKLREALGIPLGATVILTVGPIQPRKAIDVLIEAWAKLCQDYPETWLVLVGPRYDQTFPSLQQFGRRLEELAAATGAPDRIMFAGQVGNVEDYVRMADLFVFPSKREGMPNVVPEAMACGLPIISTPFLGLPTEFGRPGEHYVLAERSADSLALAMRTLMDDPQSQRQFGCRAREWVEDELDIEKSLDQYANLYRELVAQAGNGGLRA